MISILNIQKDLENKRTYINEQYNRLKNCPDREHRIEYYDHPNIEQFLNDIYKNTEVEENKNKFLTIEQNGVPGILIEFVTNDGHYNSDTKHICSYGNELTYSDNTEENLKMLFDMSIKKILDCEIDILSIDFEPKNFHNRHVSCLCGGCTVFMVYCKKNNYKFCIEIEDDADCEPGLCYVRNIYNQLTDETYPVGCDLFSQNTSKTKLKNFIELLNCKDKKEFMEKKYSKWTNLCNKLNDNSEIKASFLHEYFLDTTNITLNNYYKTIIKLQYLNKECYLIPDLENTDDNILKIVSNEEFILKKTKSINIQECLNTDESIDIKTFNRRFCGSLISYRYDESNQVEDLLHEIKNYLKYHYNNFGYYENNKYYNHTDINEIVKKYNNNNKNYVMGIHDSSNSQQDNEIDVLLTIRYNVPYYICYKDFYPEGVFPYDIYKIKITYNPKLDKYCILTLDSKWYNVNLPFKNIYYEQNDIYDKDFFSDKIKEEYAIGKVNCEGTFSQIIGFINEFSNKLINKIEK